MTRHERSVPFFHGNKFYVILSVLSVKNYSLASKSHKTSLSRNPLLSLSNQGFTAILKYAVYIKVAGVFCFDKDVSVLVKSSPFLSV